MNEVLLAQNEEMEQKLGVLKLKREEEETVNILFF